MPSYTTLARVQAIIGFSFGLLALVLLGIEDHRLSGGGAADQAPLTRANCTFVRDATILDVGVYTTWTGTQVPLYTPVYRVCVRGPDDTEPWTALAYGGTETARRDAHHQVAAYYTEEAEQHAVPCWYSTRGAFEASLSETQDTANEPVSYTAMLYVCIGVWATVVVLSAAYVCVVCAARDDDDDV